MGPMRLVETLAPEGRLGNEHTMESILGGRPVGTAGSTENPNYGNRKRNSRHHGLEWPRLEGETSHYRYSGHFLCLFRSTPQALGQHLKLALENLSSPLALHGVLIICRPGPPHNLHRFLGSSLNSIIYQICN